MLNQCSFIGRFVRDPESRDVGDNRVCNFTLAVDRGYNDETDFIDFAAWNKRGENVQKYCKKGKLVHVTGQLNIRSYDDNEGIKRKAAAINADRVLFLPDGKGKEGPAKKEDVPF